MAGVKYDEHKAPLDLLPTKAILEIGKVLDFGAKKYGAYNWRGGMAWGRLAAATMRHLFKWIEGENIDPESGINHLAHAGCNILFLLTYQIESIGEDNRYASID